MSTWYEKYTGLPYKHLGINPLEGIDCFNLCRLIYKQELNIDIPYITSDFCNIVDEDWYNKTTTLGFEAGLKTLSDWEKVTEPKIYDLVLMSIGSTNIANHVAMYVDKQKILQIMLNKKSWVAPYGVYYKQYTVGVYRWKNLKN